MPDTDGACREGPLGYDKGDLVRVLVQTLGEHGFARSAAALAEESKVPVEAEETALFRRSILDGQYDTALAILPALDPTLPEGMLRSLRFAIERERYLELLESRRIKEALVCLRTAVTPNAADAAHVHLLAGLITQSHPDEVRRRAAWRGAGPESRNALLATIQDLLPPALMLRSRRLEELLAQAFHYQLQQCPLHFHAESRPFNGLFSDHRCDDGAVAFRPKAHLSCHTDEAWFLAFSHDGRLLAAASKDHTVSVWGSENGSLVRLLSEHTAGVTHLAWSPDDQYLLTCSKDYRARVWRVADGECVRIFLLSSECNVGIWTDGGAAVVIASEDGILTKLSRDGTTFVKKALRCRDLVALDSERVLALGHEKTVYTISPADLSFKASFSESSVLSSLAPSRDRRTVLLTTLAPGEVCLWRLGPEKPQILRSYAGHANERFLVRACFARPDESIIVTGSEGSRPPRPGAPHPPRRWGRVSVPQRLCPPDPDAQGPPRRGELRRVDGRAQRSARVGRRRRHDHPLVVGRRGIAGRIK